MNILVSVNENYLDKALTMLFSLRQSTSENIDVYLMNHSLNSSQIEKIRKYLLKICRIQLHIVDVSDTPLDTFPIGDLNFSIEMYYRILAQFLLPESLDRILWLDADIIITRDISSFYYQSFDNACYVVCEDRYNGQNWINDIKKQVGINEDSVYFNSGVMLMNLPRLRKTKIDEIMQICETLKERITYPDQDILNYIYADNKVKLASWKIYNYQVSTDISIPEEISNNVAIVHYTGKRKPWDYWNISESSIPYWRIRVQQGDRWETIKAFLLKVNDIISFCHKDIKQTISWFRLVFFKK